MANKGPLLEVASEDVIAIGNGRHAHFRRDRRFGQVQVVFTAPKGINPNPGRELTDQFKEQGWAWEPHKPGKPWTYQLERSSENDPTARGDSHDALLEQFLIIINEYRQKQGLPPTLGYQNLYEGAARDRNAALNQVSGNTVIEQLPKTSNEQKAKSEKAEARRAITNKNLDTEAAIRERAGGTAEEMLDAFASVGAERFDLTLTDCAGEKVTFRSNQSLDQLRTDMPGILARANRSQQNVIIRPRGPVIQLDDLDEAAVERLRPVSFLVLRTSPGNHQAWVAVADADEDFARRLRKGAGADLSASGATRVSGSVNFKEKYAPTFPRVETVHANPGRTGPRVELEALGILAPAEKVAPMLVSRHQHAEPRGWPSYQRCVEGAPEAREGGRPDISRADFTFCLLAIDWGWSVEETATRLMQVSSKAQENGAAYAGRTAQRAAAAIERRGSVAR